MEDVSDTTVISGRCVTLDAAYSILPEHHTDKAPFVCDQDIRDYNINNLTDWTDDTIHLLEKLGIDMSSQLGQLITRLIDDANVPPVQLFKILDSVLGNNPVTLKLLNQCEPQAEKNQTFMATVKSKDKPWKSLRSLGINPSNGLDQMITQVVEFGMLPRSNVFDARESALNEDELHSLNSNPIPEGMNDHLADFTQEFLERDFMDGTSLMV